MAKSTSGQKGDKVRSDCYIEITSTRNGGINLTIKSKVNVMYGESIKTTILDMCEFFELKNAEIVVEDYGALPSTLMARFCRWWSSCHRRRCAGSSAITSCG